MPQAGQSVPVSYPAAELASDLNVVIVGWNNATSTISSVVDTAGNHYQVAAALARGTGLSQAIYYAPNVNAAAANRVTVTFNQSVPFPDIRILEYSGLDPTAPFDVAVSAAGSSTLANSGSVATTVTERVVGGRWHDRVALLGAGRELHQAGDHQPRR